MTGELGETKIFILAEKITQCELLHFNANVSALP
jgi:hypothetical protein